MSDRANAIPPAETDLDNEIIEGLEEVVFRGSLPAEYVLARPIKVEVWPEAGEWVAASVDVAVHAFGPTREAAIMSLGESLVEHFERLVVVGEKLSPALWEEREVLRQLLFRGDAELSCWHDRGLSDA